MNHSFVLMLMATIVAAFLLGFLTDMISTSHDVDLVLRLIGGLICGHVGYTIYSEIADE